SCKGWSDGIDLMCCKNVKIDNIFMRNSDDCIAIYNHRWHWYGGTDNVSVTNAVLWADIAHPINIGGHGDDTNPDGEVVEHVNFKDIDILEQDEDDPPYRGCMAIVVGDNNIARNITFENVRVESIQEGMLFNLCVMFNEKYNKTPGGAIYNILFKNISYTGYGESTSVIKGYDTKHSIHNVTFDNVTVNGEKITSLSEFSTNEFISDIKFK
ncbi:MAG: glycoside hydrolase family 28 protein, partial [Muribaculaceae bacterium]|nr:glycoside hydrolase family 28 protein [Muribaculaceae bacterium]